MPKSGLKSKAFTGSDLVAFLCFFASGFTGLVYEICWIRKASLIFGATTFAVSTVIAVFFAGLAIGSFVFGLYCRNTLRPLKIYALLEISLGILVLFNPPAFCRAERFYDLFYSSAVGSFALLSFIRFFLLAVLLLPPAILIGGTLPLFCRQYVVTEGKISQPVGLLYGLNTLGAAIGCAACGLYFVPKIGIDKTVQLGGLVNILIGLAVGCLKETAQKEQAGPVQTQDGHDSVLLVSILFFLSGFIAIGNEVLCTRYLSLIIHNTVYSYTLTLVVILVGIVIGSVFIGSVSDRMSRRPLVFGGINILIGIWVLALFMTPAYYWKAVADTQRPSGWLWMFVLLLLVPAVLSGVSFPLAVRMAVNRCSLAAAAAGGLSAVNTVGGIAGSLVTGFVVLPLLGLHKSILLSTGLSLFVGFAAILVLEKKMAAALKAAVIFSGVCLWFAVPFITGTRLPADFLAGEDKLVDFCEGLNSNMAVVRRQDDTLAFTIDRLWQGEDRKNNQIMAAHIPMLLHRDPKEVLVVGMGVGQTAGRFLMYNITGLDCVDIERELGRFIRKNFESDWTNDSRCRFIVDDGRSYIAHTPKKYDIISIEVGQVFRPGLANFYTVDFYRLARSRLKENGVICQFVPVVSFGKNEFRSVLRSFTEVFPQSLLWYNTSELLLIGSRSGRPVLSSASLEILKGDSEVGRDLRFAYWGGTEHWLNREEVLLSGFLCGPEGLSKIAAGASVYRDDPPELEYFAARNQMVSPDAVVEIIKTYMEPAGDTLEGRLSGESISKIQSLRLLNLKDIVADSLYRDYLEAGDAGLLRQAAGLNPYNVKFKNQLGIEVGKRGDLVEAVKYFTEAIKISPDFADAHCNLGYAYQLQGRRDDAVKHYRAALEINPRLSKARELLNAAVRQ